MCPPQGPGPWELKAAAAPSLRAGEGSQPGEFGFFALVTVHIRRCFNFKPSHFRQALPKHTPLKLAAFPHAVNHSQHVWKKRRSAPAAFGPRERASLLSWRQTQRCASEALLIHGQRHWRGRSQRPASATRSDSPAAQLGEGHRPSLPARGYTALGSAFIIPAWGFARIRKFIGSTCIKD